MIFSRISNTFLKNYDTWKNIHSRRDFPLPLSFYATVMLEASKILLSYVGMLELSIR